MRRRKEPGKMSVACRATTEGSETRGKDPMALGVLERRRPGKPLGAPGASLHSLDIWGISIVMRIVILIDMIGDS